MESNRIVARVVFVRPANLFSSKKSSREEVMKMKIRMSILAGVFSGIFFWAASEAVAKIGVTGLTCEEEVNPLGVESVSPAFGWKITADEPNVWQKAWQLQVATYSDDFEAGTVLWDSGKQVSAEQMNCHAEGYTFNPAQQYLWRVRVWTNEGESEWSQPAAFVTGLSQWEAKWITRPWTKGYAMPYFRKCFSLNQGLTNVVQATAYTCGLGCSELYINGERPDDRFLDPAITNYERYALYSSLDIAPLLQEGSNCVGVMLGDGWYNQDQVWGSTFTYGKPLLITQIVLRYRDGSVQIVGSDTDWQWHEGPVLRANIYAGERYDSRQEVDNWCSVATSDSQNWQPAVLAENPPPRLVSQMMQPMRPKEVRPTVRILKSGEKSWIFDFGENITGFPRIMAKQPAGTHWVMKMAENLDKTGQMDYRSTGLFATQVIQTDEYIFKGTGVESWQPRFTYHGFRFLELTGCEGTPEKSWITAVTMHSDVGQRGTFACANQQINRLHKMAVCTVYNNIQGLPTDCPHRERCGWLGDTHVYVKMANLNLDLQNFWDKYLLDIRSCAEKQLSYELFHLSGNTNFYFGAKPAGLPFMIAPGKRLCGVASPDWGTAMVQLPWNLYLYYGNKEKLAKFYPDMKAWVDYISLIAEDGLVTKGLGDWCPPGGNRFIECPIEFSSSAFHYLDLKIMTQSAKALGKPDDAAFYQGQCAYVKRQIIAKFYDAEKGTFGSQTANALALDMALFPEGDEHKGADAIAKDMIERHGGFMHCGIFGLARIGNALSDHGRAEDAWKMFTKVKSPSFATMWNMWDATTLWEVLPTTDSEQSSTDSKNHPMQAGYDSWFYESVAGIRPDPLEPGFKHIIFCPQECEYLDWAETVIETGYGRVSIHWEKKNGVLTYSVEIPPNTTGTVELPAHAVVTVNQKPFELAEGECRLGSGKYTIQIQPKP